MTEKPDKSDVAPTTPASPPRLSLREFLCGHREAVLQLDGHDYRLRITPAGKLIPTK
ncbi:MAG: hemin uptake protein HemP [Hyphomicrobium sp.]